MAPLRIRPAPEDCGRAESVDIWLTNQQKGEFHAHPHVEIEYSIFPFSILEHKNIKIKPNSHFLNFFWKKEKRINEPFSHFSTFNIKSKNE